MARPEKIRLGEILVQQGLLTAEQLNQSLEEQKRSGRKLGRVFILPHVLPVKRLRELAALLEIVYRLGRRELEQRSEWAICHPEARFRPHHQCEQ